MASRAGGVHPTLTMATLNIFSYNVRGLNHATKQRQVLRELKQVSCSIAFLQETHLTHTTPVRLFSPQFPKWYYSLSDTNKAKGVAIGFLVVMCPFSLRNVGGYLWQVFVSKRLHRQHPMHIS